MEARFRLGDSVRSLPPGLPWELTVSSVQYSPPEQERGPAARARRSRPSSASVSTRRRRSSLSDVPCPSQNRVVRPCSQTLGVRISVAVRAARVVVLGYGPQPVVEGAPAQGQALADDTEPAAVVEGDRGVEAAPAVELHARPERVDAGRE